MWMPTGWRCMGPASWGGQCDVSVWSISIPEEEGVGCFPHTTTLGQVSMTKGRPPGPQCRKQKHLKKGYVPCNISSWWANSICWLMVSTSAGFQ